MLKVKTVLTSLEIKTTQISLTWSFILSTYNLAQKMTGTVLWCHLLKEQKKLHRNTLNTVTSETTKILHIAIAKSFYNSLAKLACINTVLFLILSPFYLIVVLRYIRMFLEKFCFIPTCHGILFCHEVENPGLIMV